MSTSAANAATFYDEASREQSVWTVRDARGFPAPMNADDQRAQPFWSLRSRAQRIVEHVPAYANFELVEISLATFCDRWLPGLGRDGIRVGLNWAGQSATGYDVDASDVAARFDDEPKA